LFAIGLVTYKLCSMGDS